MKLVVSCSPKELMEKRIANTQKPIEARASKSLAMKSKCLGSSLAAAPAY